MASGGKLCIHLPSKGRAPYRQQDRRSAPD